MNLHPKIDRTAAGFILLLSGIPALWLLTEFFADGMLLLRSQSWQETPAFVTKIRSAGKTGKSYSHTDKYGRRIFSYARVSDLVEFVYVVDGKTFTSAVFGPFAMWNFGSSLKNFGHGPAQAFVNPGNAGEAVLDRSVREGFWISLLVTSVLTLWFVWAVMASFFHKRYLRAFWSHALIVLPVGILTVALILSEATRDLRWWLVVGGFLGTPAMIGFGYTLSLWTRHWNLVVAAGMVLGFLVTFGGACLPGS